MPLYKYLCAKCGHAMEKLEKSDAEARHVCEKCGSRRVERALPSFSVGSGSEASRGSCPTGTCPLS